MLINQQNLITLQRGLKTVFQDGLNYDFQNVSDLLCTKVKSTGDGENYSWVEELGQLSEFVDELDLSNLQAKSFYIENKMYAKGITIDVNLVEDDKFDIIKSKVTQGLSSQTGRHTDIALKDAVQAGFNHDCYDDNYLFDTDHPTYDGNVASNYDSTAGTSSEVFLLLDSKQPVMPFIRQIRKDPWFQMTTNPDAETIIRYNKIIAASKVRYRVWFGMWQPIYASKNNLTQTTFETYEAVGWGLKGPTGEYLNINYDTVIVGNAKRADARALFETPTLTGGAANPMYGRCKVVHFKGLSDVS